jgi:hypothetical protein
MSEHDILEASVPAPGNNEPSDPSPEPRGPVPAPCPQRGAFPGPPLVHRRCRRASGGRGTAPECPQWKLSDGSLYSPARRANIRLWFRPNGAKVDVGFTIGDFKAPTSATGIITSVCGRSSSVAAT